MEDRIRKYLALSEHGFPEGPSFAVSGHFTENGGVYVDKIGTAPESNLPIPFTDYDLILLNASGAAIACNMLQQGRIHVVPPMRKGWKPGQSLGCYSETTGKFNATVPRIDGGVTLAIERDGVRLWTRHAPQEFPKITDLTCEIVDGHGRLQWSDNVVADSPEYSVRGGFENAEGVSGGLTHRDDPNAPSYENPQTPRNLFEFNITELPVGPVTVSITLNAGFYSAKSEPLAVIVPERAIEFALTEATASLGLGTLGKLEIRAIAYAFGGAGGSIKDPAAFEWTIDGQPAGDGACLAFDPPAIGRHVATVALRWRGQNISKSVNFEVTAKLLSDLAELRIEMENLFMRRGPLR